MNMLIKTISIPLSCLLMASSFNAFAGPSSRASAQLGQCSGLKGAAFGHCMAGKGDTGGEVVNDCPAWSMDELNSIGSTAGATLQNDVIGTAPRGSTTPFYSITDSEDASAAYPDRTSLISSAAIDNDGSFSGVFVHSVVFADSTQGTNTDINRSTGLTAEEFEICKQQIMDHVI